MKTKHISVWGNPSRADVLARLAKIEGHVRSIRSMVEAERACDDVLTQIAAVKAALDQAAKLILHEHMRTCVQDAMKQGKGDQVLQELETAINRLIR